MGRHNAAGLGVLINREAVSETHTKRVYMIAPYFPPRRRVGSLRPFRFATSLGEHGWSARVACLRSTGELTAREHDRLMGVSTFTLAAAGDRTERRAKPIEAGPVTLWSALGQRLSREVDRWVPVDTWAPLLLSQMHRVLRDVAHHRPHVIWSTADPWSSHLLALWVARRHGLPWVADFRDPWTLCAVRESPRPWPTRRLNARVEAHLLRHADAVVYTANGTTAKYQRAFPDVARRMHTIENGFDSQAFDDRVYVTPSARAVSPASTLDVTFFGAFRDLSPAEPVLECLMRAHEKDPQRARRIRLHTYGAPSRRERRRLELSGMAHSVVFHDAVPHGQALGVMRKADVLLLSTHHMRDEIIPAKLWDYLAAGRPVLSLCRNVDVDRVLRSTGAGKQVVTDTPEDGAAVLIACVRAKDEGETLPLDFSLNERGMREHDVADRTARLARILRRVSDEKQVHHGDRASCVVQGSVMES